MLVSHDLAVVSQTCSRVYVMYAGRVVEDGDVHDLLEETRHPYTFALLRSVPDPDQPMHRLLTITGPAAGPHRPAERLRVRAALPVHRGAVRADRPRPRAGRAARAPLGLPAARHGRALAGVVRAARGRAEPGDRTVTALDLDKHTASSDVLAIEGLKQYFPGRRSWADRLRGVPAARRQGRRRGRPGPAQGRDAGPGRRVGMRQVDAEPVRDGAVPADRRARSATAATTSRPARRASSAGGCRWSSRTRTAR